MLEFRERQKRRRVLSSNITIGVLCIVIAIAAKETWDLYAKERHARELLENARVRQESLGEREAFLKSELANLGDEEGVEGELRERFGIAKPGEKVIVLIDEEATTTFEEPKKGWWARLWSWFE